MKLSVTVQARVLKELSDRYRAIDIARQSAISSNDVVRVVNAVRQQREERIIEADDVPRLLKLENFLYEIAKDPFGPLPPEYATYVCSIAPDELDKVAPKTAKTFELYERQIFFEDFKNLAGCLRRAVKAYPALEPRLAPLVDTVQSRVSHPGPAYLYYTGCCVSGSPGSRATDDFKITGSLFTNLVKLWQVKQVKVYKVNVPPVDIDVYEYRAARCLQLEEHSLITLRYPLCLNSAAGGFWHEYRLDIFDVQERTLLPHDPVPFSLADAVRRHIVGMYNSYASRPESSSRRINPATLEIQVLAATPRFTFERRVPMVAISKDITEEAFYGRHAELGYRERLAGPGPQATNSALLYQSGSDLYAATTEDRLHLLPPFTDLFAFITLH